MANKCI